MNDITRADGGSAPERPTLPDGIMNSSYLQAVKAAQQTGEGGLSDATIEWIVQAYYDAAPKLTFMDALRVTPSQVAREAIRFAVDHGYLSEPTQGISVEAIMEVVLEWCCPTKDAEEDLRSRLNKILSNS